MGPSLHLRLSRTLAATALFLAGVAVTAAAVVAVGAPADSPSAAGVIPAVTANALEDAQLTAADVALASGDQDGPAGAAKRAGRPLGLLRMIIGRTERAEITVSTGTGTGTRTLLYVRGEITALSTSSVTVTINDGTRASFAIAATTRVREKGKDIKATDLSTGDRAMVFGLRNADGTYTATLVRCVREAARRAPASSPAPSPPG
jgi:hypothetical protein